MAIPYLSPDTRQFERRLRAEARRKRLAASLEVISSGLLVLFFMAALATGLGLICRLWVWFFNYGFRAF